MIKLNEACPTTENPGNTVSVIVGHETNLVASFKTPFDNSFTERSMFGGLEERRVEKRKLELRASDWWQGHTGLRLGVTRPGRTLRVVGKCKVTSAVCPRALGGAARKDTLAFREPRALAPSQCPLCFSRRCRKPLQSKKVHSINTPLSEAH